MLSLPGITASNIYELVSAVLRELRVSPAIFAVLTNDRFPSTSLSC